MVQLWNLPPRTSLSSEIGQGLGQGLKEGMYQGIQAQLKNSLQAQQSLLQNQQRGQTAVSLADQLFGEQPSEQKNQLIKALSNLDTKDQIKGLESLMESQILHKYLQEDQQKNQQQQQEQNTPFNAQAPENQKDIQKQKPTEKMKRVPAIGKLAPLARQQLGEEKLQLQKDIHEDRLIDKSYDAQKNFIDNTTSSFKGFETEMKPRLLQMQKLNDGTLIGAAPAKFLEAVGIPLGVLENPSNELYSKLSQDLLKGLPETYGSRILKVEVENFLKTIPTLMNSADGRRLIASNALKLGQMKEVFYNEMRRQQKNLLSENKRFPKDFEQNVFDNVKPQLDKLNNQFVKLSEVKHVPKGTIPFFDPQGEISFVPEKDVEWAMQNEGERIW